MRRTFYAGLGAVFTTEEGIRKLASDFHLPKDITNYLIQQAATSKDELFRVVGKELRGFLETVNVSGQSPVVDVQSNSKAQVLARDVLNAVPTRFKLPIESVDELIAAGGDVVRVNPEFRAFLGSL